MSKAIVLVAGEDLGGPRVPIFHVGYTRTFPLIEVKVRLDVAYEGLGQITPEDERQGAKTRGSILRIYRARYTTNGIYRKREKFLGSSLVL